MKKYVILLASLFLSGCNQLYQEMKHVDCANFSNRHVISVHAGISGSDQIVKALSDIIGNHSICERVNQEIDKYCRLGNISHQTIQGRMTISRISNSHLLQYLGSGGKRSALNDSINFLNSDISGKWSDSRCNLHHKQKSLLIDRKQGFALTKIHRKGLKLYIKYDKSRYIDVMINK